MNSFFCCSVPKSRNISTVGRLPTIELSFCKSLCRPEALGRQVLADDRHREVGAVLAAVFLGQRVAIMPGLVGAPAHLAQQRFPFVARQAVAFEVGARPFAAMVEKTDVVVLAFERLDFFFDERVQLGEIGGHIGRNIKIHGVTPQAITLMCEAYQTAAVSGSAIDTDRYVLHFARNSRSWLASSTGFSSGMKCPQSAIAPPDA